jgi:hypothetical protein
VQYGVEMTEPAEVSFEYETKVHAVRPKVPGVQLAVKM